MPLPFLIGAAIAAVAVGAVVHHKKKVDEKRKAETEKMHNTASSASSEYKQSKAEEKSYVQSNLGDYSRYTSSVSEVERTEDVLRKLRRSVKKLADKMEKRAFEYSHGAIDYIIDELKNINDQQIGGKSLNLNLRSLKNSVEKIERDNQGFIKNYTDRRVSLDDDECVDILEIRDKDDRADEMEDFKDTVVKEALEQLSEKIKDGIEEQTSLVFEKIESRLSDMEDMTQKKTQDVDNIYKLKQQDDDKFELKIINLAFDTGVCDLALELVGNTPDTVKVNVQKIPELKDVVSRFERTVRKADNDNGLAVNYKVKIKSGSKNYFGGSIPATAFSQVWTVTRINGSKIYLKNNDGSSLIIKEEYIERGI